MLAPLRSDHDAAPSLFVGAVASDESAPACNGARLVGHVIGDDPGAVRDELTVQHSAAPERCLDPPVAGANAWLPAC